MMPFLIKNLFSIVLGLGLIIGFIILTPSCKKKIKIEDTVVSVKEINDIGELVTAEYYGEVLSSLSLIEDINIMDTIFRASYDSIKHHIHIIDSTTVTKYDRRLNNVNIESKEIYSAILAFKKSGDTLKRKFVKLTAEQRRLERRKNRLDAKIQKKKFRLFKKSLTPTEKYALKILEKTSGNNKKELKENLEMSTSFEDFAETHRENIEKLKTKYMTNGDIAYIGRGSVKVGYDLKTLDSLNVFISPLGDTIYFLDFDPIMFDVDINPWFYFEDSLAAKVAEGEENNQLYGFELIYTDNENKITLEHVKQVKSDCKRQLRQEALDRDIFEIARINAEESLQSFFQLLSLQPGQDVKKVIISHTKYFDDKVEYLYDERIDKNELEEIRKLLKDDSLYLDDISFPYQNLNYQLYYLDKFIEELTEATFGNNNVRGWETLSSSYLKSRGIN